MLDEREGAQLRGRCLLAWASTMWAVANPVLDQLLFWRPVPGYRPSDDAFAPATHIVATLRRELRKAVRNGELGRGAASDEAMALLSTLHFGDTAADGWSVCVVSLVRSGPPIVESSVIPRAGRTGPAARLSAGRAACTSRPDGPGRR